MAKNNSELKSIQKKLMAAIAMVLVASVMVVSSSYAWFTLSTAPEVTGIQTSVGSNGNLEMALRTGELKDIITGGTGSSNKWPESNEYWGNLVNLEDGSYGMGNITLAPARLNAEKDTANSKTVTKTYTIAEANYDDTTYALNKVYPGTEDEIITSVEGPTEGNYTITTTTYYDVYKMVMSSGFLQTPEYGTDGRIEKLNANTVNGVYDPLQSAFKGALQSTEYGVRAVGTTSNISPEALALRNAKSTVNSTIDSAKASGSLSMQNYAVPMAGLIVQNQLNVNYVYNNDDYQLVVDAVADLTKVVDSLENAMKEAVVAVGLAQGEKFTAADVVITSDAITVQNGTVTLYWNGETKTINGEEVTLQNLSTQLADLKAAAAVIAQMRTDLGTSTTALNAVSDKNSPKYSELQAAMAPLVSVSGLKIIKGDQTYYLSGENASDMMVVAGQLVMGGATITLTDGIYADIASMVGDYSKTDLSMSIDTAGTSYQSIVEQFFPGQNGKATVSFNMATEAVEPANGYHLVYISTWMATLSVASEGAASDLITNTYGYIVDLAFRTNAAGSSLLLQTDAADRVSNSNGEDSVTMGGGSYMQFTTGGTDFTVAQMVSLMDYIRVVMVDDEGTIYGIAKLDMGSTAKDYANVSSATELQKGGTYTDPTTNETYTITEVVAGTHTETDGTITTYNYTTVTVAVPNYEVNGNTVKAYLYMHAFSVNDGIVTMGDKKDGTIMALEQNTAQELSCLVYLDGDKVENKDVAISGNSMTGTMNLQFASSATLVPMDYTFATQEQLKAPTASISGNTLTVGAPSEIPDGATVKYEIYVTPAGSTTGILAHTLDAAGTYDLSQVSSIDGVVAGDYAITVVAVAEGYKDSTATSAGTYTVLNP